MHSKSKSHGLSTYGYKVRYRKVNTNNPGCVFKLVLVIKKPLGLYLPRGYRRLGFEDVIYSLTH